MQLPEYHETRIQSHCRIPSLHDKSSRIVAKLLQTRSSMEGGQGKVRGGGQRIHVYCLCFVIRKHTVCPIYINTNKELYNELFSIYLNESYEATILPFSFTTQKNIHLFRRKS